MTPCVWTTARRRVAPQRLIYRAMRLPTPIRAVIALAIRRVVQAIALAIRRVVQAIALAIRRVVQAIALAIRRVVQAIALAAQPMQSQANRAPYAPFAVMPCIRGDRSCDAWRVSALRAKNALTSTSSERRRMRRRQWRHVSDATRHGRYWIFVGGSDNRSSTGNTLRRARATISPTSSPSRGGRVLAIMARSSNAKPPDATAQSSYYRGRKDPSGKVDRLRR
jgi:hypothetical protein